MRLARIYHHDALAGLLTEDGGEYRFRYDQRYLARPNASAVSLTLPCGRRTMSARHCSRFSTD